MEEVRNKGMRNDKLTPIVDTPVACPIEDSHNVVSSPPTSDDTLLSEVSQTEFQKTDAIKNIASSQPIPRSTNVKEAEKVSYVGGAIFFPLEEPLYKI